MSKTKKGSTEETPEEQPQRGGSYVRNEDGTLTLVEGPEEPDAPPPSTEQDPTGDTGDTGAPGNDGQEG